MFEKDLLLPESGRQSFKEPLGRELSDKEAASLGGVNRLVTVGDVVSLTFRKLGIRPFLSVYDGRTERREMTEFARLVEDEPKNQVDNPAGKITAGMAESIRRSMDGSGGLIRVEGEEDLALLPCILMAPDGTEIVYGMPGKCMMLVVTDDLIRKKAADLVATMEEIE
jgi:hypothetical protein